MQKIYRLSDRIPLNIGGLTAKVGPLSFSQKAEIQAEVLKGDAMAPLRGAKLAIQYGLKELSGLIDGSGQEYQLEITDGKLSDVCVDELLNLQISEKLAMICLNLISGIPEQFMDPNTGKPLSGVEIVSEEADGKKSNPRPGF